MACHGQPLEHRGRRAMTVQEIAEQPAADAGYEWRGPSIGQRGRNDQAIATDWSHTPGTTPAPRHQVATDAAAAVLYAGLADADALPAVLGGGYLVTARDASPSHEYLKVSPGLVPGVVHYYGGKATPAPRLTRADHVALAMAPAWWTTCTCTAADKLRDALAAATAETNVPALHRAIRRLCSCQPADYVHQVTVPTRVMLASAANPGGYNRGGYALAREAAAIFRQAGERHATGDVFDRNRRRYHSAPDRVAFRGVARITRPSPVRYEITTTDATVVGHQGQLELSTRLAWWTFCTCPASRLLRTPGKTAAAILAARQGTPAADKPLTFSDVRKYARDRCSCQPRGWRGHRRVVFADTARVTKALVRQARPAGAAVKGPAVTPWNLSDRSLQAAAVKVADLVAAAEQVLRQATEGTVVTFASGASVTVLGAAQVFDGQRERAYPVRNWCRRAALAHLLD